MSRNAHFRTPTRTRHLSVVPEDGVVRTTIFWQQDPHPGEVVVSPNQAFGTLRLTDATAPELHAAFCDNSQGLPQRIGGATVPSVCSICVDRLEAPLYDNRYGVWGPSDHPG
jgi:hypothetical protein